LLGLLLPVALLGCGRGQGPAGGPEVPAIPVSKPVRRQVTDFVEYTGRLAAINAVDIKARVTGYIVEVPYKEGATVKKGDLLFQIDPRPYQALVDQAQAQVNLNEASLQIARTTYARDQAINQGQPGAVSPQLLDQERAQIEEARAAIRAAQANLEAARLNLSFCRVTAPIDGQVSRYYLTLGNLALQDQTLLTTVVSLDPIYGYFDLDEPTLLRIRRAINAGDIPLPRESREVLVQMGLQGEDGYPHEGYIDFVNNVVNPNTGTIAVRGVFDNPKPEHGARLLSPGMFVRIRLPMGRPYDAVLVADRAIGSDQGLNYVYVVGDDHKVRYQRVTLGPLQDDGLRVIRKGVKADDLVVSGGLQQVRPNQQIEPEEVPMPAIGAEPQDGDNGAGPKPEK
jgi:multidrug efflux system membrane fusion protein